MMVIDTNVNEIEMEIWTPCQSQRMPSSARQTLAVTSFHVSLLTIRLYRMKLEGRPVKINNEYEQIINVGIYTDQ